MRRHKAFRVQAAAQRWSTARHALCTRQTTNRASLRMRQLLAIKTPFKAHTILANSSFLHFYPLAPPAPRAPQKPHASRMRIKIFSTICRLPSLRLGDTEVPHLLAHIHHCRPEDETNIYIYFFG